MKTHCLDKFLASPDTHVAYFNKLINGEICSLTCNNFINKKISKNITRRLLSHEVFTEHADVPGLKVLGLSHFQAVRDKSLISTYSEFGQNIEEQIRRICAPHKSPFTELLSYLSFVWPPGIQQMKLDGEPQTAPFTIRVCSSG